jgi:Domain of unknown function (DUF4168)
VFFFLFSISILFPVFDFDGVQELKPRSRRFVKRAGISRRIFRLIVNAFPSREKPSRLRNKKAMLDGTNLGLLHMSSGIADPDRGIQPRQKGGFMTVQLRVIATCAAILGMSLALPSFAAATMSEKAASNIAYAQNSETAPSRVDDATLKRAAAAYVKVRDITVKAEQEINSTDDTAKKQQLADESESEKLAAVKAQGMEPQQYNNVIMLVKDDSTLQQKFLSYVQQLRRTS